MLSQQSTTVALMMLMISLSPMFRAVATRNIKDTVLSKQEDVKVKNKRILNLK
jgi:hypothetical protein